MSILLVSPRLKTATLFKKLQKELPDRTLHIDKAEVNKAYRYLIQKMMVKPIEQIVTSQDLLEVIQFTYERTLRKPLYQWLPKTWIKSKLMKQAEAYFQYFDYLYQKESIKMVAVWNGSRLILSCAALLAKKYGIKTVYFENGLLPGTLTCDDKGVNYYSSLTNLTPEFYLELAISAEQIKDASKLPWSTRPARIHRAEKRTEGELPQDYVFLPFQVYTDSQVLVHSDIRSMETLTEIVIHVIECYRKMTGRDLYLVTKEHPSDIGRINYKSFYKKYRHAHAVFLTTGNTENLIEGSKLVITLNSSVGLEALYFRKPVITMGRSFYSKPGLTFQASNQEELEQVLPVALECVPNEELISKFFYYLKKQYLLNVDTKRFNDEDIDAIVKRMESVLNDGTYA